MTEIKRKNISVTDFGAIGDGKTNDSKAFKKAINFLNEQKNSVINFSLISGGVIEVPAGHFLIDSQIMKSNITIKGKGIGKTILSPYFNNNNKFLFDVKGTDTENRLVNFELKELSIMPSAEYQYNIELDSDLRYPASIINFSYTSSCRLSNIMISGFSGTAIKLKEHYDSSIDNVQLLGCGSNSYNSIYITVGTSDGTNALHITNPRFESCSAIRFKGKNRKFQREIQFLGGKFENTNIIYEGTSSVNFIGTHFTWFSKVPLLNIIFNSTTESYGLKFIGCSFLSLGLGSLVNGYGVKPKFLGCSIKGFKKVAENGSFEFSSCEFYDCSAPILNCDNMSTITNNEFTTISGLDNEFAIKISSNCLVTGNKFRGFLNQNIIALLIIGADNKVYFNEILSVDIGIFLQSKSTGNDIFNNKGLTKGSDNNWSSINNVQEFFSLHVPHFSKSVEGNLKYDVNEKKMFLYKDKITKFDIIPTGQIENVKLLKANEINSSNLANLYNELINKMIASGYMKP